MTIFRQSSGNGRPWSEWLPYLVCTSAAITLVLAALAGMFGQRLNTLVHAQQSAVATQKALADETLAKSFEAAKADWSKQRVSLEKELLSAKLKIKAEQTTSANIRKRLATLQKQVAALQPTGADDTAPTTAAKPSATPTSSVNVAPAAATGGTPTATTLPPTGSTAKSNEKAPPSKAVTPMVNTASAPEMAITPVSSIEPASPNGTPTEAAPATAAAAASTPTSAAGGETTLKRATAPPVAKPQLVPTQSPVLDVPDAGTVASE
ncbi:MAG: hypothetical protein QNJ22_01420 [Desulfosarcinaceae bacterium]|nr:hypothetical protein [Desulfosarcinaceae bacterium]